eukprot:4341002-Prymnesium_polylepis.1
MRHDELTCARTLCAHTRAFVRARVSSARVSFIRPGLDETGVVFRYFVLSTGASPRSAAETLQSGEHALDMGLQRSPLGYGVLTYGQNIGATALSCSRDGLYGLADLTCWPELIGRP